MGYSAERNGFVTARDMLNALVADMITNGFRLIYPADGDGVGDPTLISDIATEKFVLDATTMIDPLADEQPWRIYMEPFSENWIRFHVATPLQIQVNYGDVEITQTYLTLEDSQTMSGKLGNKNEEDIKSDFVIPGTEEYEGWTTKLEYYINMYIGSDPVTGAPTGTSYPFSYRVSISDHGVAFCTWMEAQDQFGEMFSWFVVQRPVHPKTGKVLVYGKTPLFCIYSIQGGGQLLEGLEYTVVDVKNIKYFAVREKDVNTQGSYREATRHTKFGPAIINPLKQVSFTEDNEYIINFPNGLCTDRYAYIHEMDMIGYTSGRVISQWTMADVHMYGEMEVDGVTPKKRRYQALHCNEPLNEGMRILMLVDGGGVNYACPPIETSIGTHPPIPPFTSPPTSQPPPSVLGFTISMVGGEVTLDEGTLGQLQITRAWSNGSSTTNTNFQGITLTSSDPVITVSDSGAVSAGSVNEDTSSNIEAVDGSLTSTLEVTAKDIGTLDSYSLALAGGGTSIYENKLGQLSVSRVWSTGATTVNNSFYGIEPSSSDDTILSIDDDGVITTYGVTVDTPITINAGTEDIIVSVIVDPVVSLSLTLEDTGTSIFENKTGQLLVTRVYASGTQVQSSDFTGLTAASANATILDVDADGVITTFPVTADTVVTVTVDTTTFNVTVVKNVITGYVLALQGGGIRVYENKTAQLVVSRVWKDLTTTTDTDLSELLPLSSDNSVVLAVLDTGELIAGAVSSNTTVRISGGTEVLDVIVVNDSIVMSTLGTVSGTTTLEDTAIDQLTITRTWASGTLTTNQDFTGIALVSSNPNVLSVDDTGILLASTVTVPTTVSITANGTISLVFTVVNP